MKPLILLIGLAMAVAAGESLFPDYHLEYGIPKMARIKAAESAIDFDGSRITGGFPVRETGLYPHFAGVLVHLTDERLSLCGSSLISNTRLVTAAHCWKTEGALARSFTVVLGSVTLISGGVRINTSDVVMHPNYNMVNLNNDVAVIRIRHVNYDNAINAIPLAKTGDFVGVGGVILGFGAIDDDPEYSDILLQTSPDVIDNAYCASYYGTEVVIDSTLCTSHDLGNSPCIGDAGGSLTFYGSTGRILIGIISFQSALGCLRAPAGYARVTSFASWIRAQ